MPTAEHELASVLDALGTTDALPSEHAELAEHFDTIYRDAHDDADQVPWHRPGANPPLIAWLNAEAPALVRPGACAAVVGCGLGDDVAELTRRGYDAVGFDIGNSAIEWAKRRHPDLADAFLVADAISPPHSLARRFDLVVEVYTIQALPTTMRADVVSGIASLLRPHGTLLTICRGRDEGTPIDEAAGPPYPIAEAELRQLMADCGLAPTRDIDDFYDDEDPPQRRLRAAFRHA